MRGGFVSLPLSRLQRLWQFNVFDAEKQYLDAAVRGALNLSNHLP